MIGELTFIWLGSVAVLASVGVFVSMDPTTDTLMPFIAAVIWGAFGLVGFDVAITDTNPPVTTSAGPVAYLGFMFAFMAMAFGIWQLVTKPAKEMETATEDPFKIDQ